MKTYLLLEDGTTYDMPANPVNGNLLGTIILNQDKLVMTCSDTGNHIDMPVDPSLLSHELSAHHPLLGKVITDELPIDYHIYDLKTVII